MSLTPSRKPSSGQRRRSVGTSVGGRCPHSDASSTNTYPGRVRAAESSSPSPRTYPSTPRRQAKHPVYSDHHGIRPPTPEQYLTPLQQKEVCIRHLRARLRDNVERLQHRDSEIDALRSQLTRMQADWVEEECQRVEAQLALKEARREILLLQELVDSVQSSLVHQDPPDPQPYSGLQETRAGGRSRSCGCSPASTLTRGATRQSSEALQPERGTNESARTCRASGQSHLLLEAALSEQQGPVRGPPPVRRSSTYERLCGGGAVVPASHSCHSLSSGCRCSGHAYPLHHHLFLHLPQGEPPPPPLAPPTYPTPAPAGEKKREVRSRACSPTRTWLQEELSVISSDVAPSERPFSLSPPPGRPYSPPPADEPHTRQPLPAVPGPAEAVEGEGANEDASSPQLGHWSRYFLVDLLALTAPVVPAVAWLCRGGAAQDVLPAYHIGSLLRGCCAVALHTLRRQSAGRGRTTTGGPPPV